MVVRFTTCGIPKNSRSGRHVETLLCIHILIIVNANKVTIVFIFESYTGCPVCFVTDHQVKLWETMVLLCLS